jgi:membrane protein
MEVLGRNIGVLVKKTVSETLDDNLLGLSAETAYSFFFGLFPLMLFAAPLLSLFGNRQQIFDAVLARLSPSVPPDALALVEQVLRDVVFTKNAPGLISIGAVLSLWAGAGMFGSLISALNVAYDVKESRPWWKQKLIAIACAIVAIVVLWGSTLVLVAGEEIVTAVVRALHLGQFGTVVWTIVQYALAFAMVVLFIWMVYLILPNLHTRPATTLPGAIFAAVFWVIFSYAFRLYVTHFGSYNKTYGTIGAVIVLLTWIYWTMFAILVGGEFNSELHAGTGVVAGESRALPSDRVATREGLPHSSSELY